MLPFGACIFIGRLNLSSGGRSLEGFGCSPIKRLRELGLIRRKSVWSLSFEGKKVKGNTVSSTKGLITRVSIVHQLLAYLLAPLGSHKH